MLWRDLRVNPTARDNGSQQTEPIYLDLIVEGETAGKTGRAEFEF